MQVSFDIPQTILIALLAIICVTGMVLHVMANRHRKPGVPLFGHKDSLMRNKEALYTEAGQKYVWMQKRLVVVAMILVVLLFAVSAPAGS